MAAEIWKLAHEYPATSLPGEGDFDFARRVAEKTKGRVSIVVTPDARLGYDSRGQLKAVAEGKVAMADTFSGALGAEHPIFALSSLPFIVASIAEAKVLYDEARSAYDAAFANHNQKLLFSTPWPASGLWTRAPVQSIDALARLRIRTYDETGAELFSGLGATAIRVSFAELPARLAGGEIDAVLSSGDGGAGRELWGHLPLFTAIGYAMPLSFTTVNLDKWSALDAVTRRAMEEAASQTQARQWKALEGRVEKNYRVTREHGVTINAGVSPELMARLRQAGRVAAAAWIARTGAEGKRLAKLLRLPP
jgi:TRAP-type C4-dicarboxylate transport system substrate-binding protein